MNYKYDKDTGILYGKYGKPIGSVNHHGYLMSRIDGKSQSVHRYVYMMVSGRDIPEGYQVDHINGIKTDNRWSNLRLVTQTDNMKNMKLFRNNKSGVTGVRFDRTRSRWKVTLSNDTLGYYKTFEDAVDARRLAEKEHNYHINHGRIA